MDTLSFTENIGIVYLGEREVVVPLCSLKKISTSSAIVSFQLTFSINHYFTRLNRFHQCTTELILGGPLE